VTLLEGVLAGRIARGCLQMLGGQHRLPPRGVDKTLDNRAIGARSMSEAYRYGR